MAWPDDRDLPLEMEAAFGADLSADPGSWLWTDLSGRVTATPVRNRVGKSGGADRVSPGTCTITLLNDDGALTPLNAASLYWPYVDLGTPLRMRLRRDEDAFARTVSNSWGTADSDRQWQQAGGVAANYSVSGGAGRHAHTTVNNLRITYLPSALLDCEQVVDIAPSVLLTGAALVTGVIARHTATTYYWLRAEFNAGGTSVALKISKYVDGTATELAVLNPLPGVAYAANTYLRLRASVVGSRLAMKVWPAAGVEPAGWQLTATDTAITVPGRTGLQSWLVNGNTNALPVTALHKNYAVRVDLAARYIDQIEPTYVPVSQTETASAIRITASGLLRRLSQGTKPARSAPARYLPTTNPVAYWTLEDGRLAAEGAATIGGQPMRPFVGTHPSGAVVTSTQWGRGELAPWLPEVVSRTGNRGLAIIWAPVTMPATGRWVIDMMYRSGTDAGDSTIDVNPSYVGGVLGWPQLLLLPSERAVDVAMNGEPEVNASAPTLFDGQPHHVRWDAFQNGARVSWNVYVDTVLVNSGTTAGNMTLPTVQQLALTAAAQDGAGLAQGHVAVWTTPPPVEGASAAAHGHVGELAATRVARLCAEEGIPVSVTAGHSTALGPQGTAGVLELLQEAEHADMGLLTEQGHALAYTPVGARYNTPTALTVDLAQYKVLRGGQEEVLRPILDDQDVRNEWTVSRPDGGEATYIDQAHQERVGVYSDSTEVNVASDDQLPDQASWRVGLGTRRGTREGTFPIDLAANPELLDGWLSCRVGSRILRTNPPTVAGPDLDRLAVGWTETFGPRSWQVQVVPEPAAPWDVAVVDGVERVSADGSTLAAAVTVSGTTLSLASTAAGGLWTTDPADFPLDLLVGGEQVRVSAITGAASPQAATVSARAVNGVSRAWPVGTPVDVWAAAYVAL